MSRSLSVTWLIAFSSLFAGRAVSRQYPVDPRAELGTAVESEPLVMAPFVGSNGTEASTERIETTGGTCVDWMGNTWTRAGSPGDVGGPGEANWYIDQLAEGDVAMIQYAVDRYYLNATPGMSWRWGKGWLAKHIAVVLLMRAFELRSQLSPELQQALDRVAVDSLDEATFRIDNCGVRGNSCAEDFASMMVVASIARNLYPGVVAVVGDSELERIEKKYYRLSFTTRNGAFGLVRETSAIDGKEYVLVQNHSGQSAVYSAVVLTQLGNALHAYLTAGRSISSFYNEDPELSENVKSMTAWLQTTALPDGSAFIVGCEDYPSGLAVSCNDPAFANTLPTFIPGGRVVALLYGDAAFGPGFQFRRFELYDHGDSANRGRVYQYNDINPDSVDTGVVAALTGNRLRLDWSNFGGLSYDVWGPGGRIGTTAESSFEMDLVFTGSRASYGLVLRQESGRIIGVDFRQLVRHLARRHLGRDGG